MGKLSRAVIALLAAAGCSRQPQQLPPAVSLPDSSRPKPARKPADFVGMQPANVKRQLGPPDSAKSWPDRTIWTYGADRHVIWNTDSERWAPLTLFITADTVTEAR